MNTEYPDGVMGASQYYKLMVVVRIHFGVQFIQVYGVMANISDSKPDDLSSSLSTSAIWCL